jgi:V/A-type H+-transporting ATPase subunit D
LRHRLAAARRGADLLDSKLRILRREEQRFAVLAERTRLEWEASVAEAERWLLRAAVLGGQRGVRADPGAATAALPMARAAYRRALEAAVAHAAADGAARVVSAEVRTTRLRLRAIQDRWVPRLEQALAGVEASLLEAEGAENVRLRWVARARQPRRRTEPASEVTP